MKKTLLFFILFLFLAASVYGQDKTNRTFLRTFAEKKQVDFEIEQAKVDAFAAKHNLTKRHVSPDGKIRELVAIRDGRPVYYETENVSAAVSVSSDKLWLGGLGGYDLSGFEETIGVWDGGAVLKTHVEFTGRVTQKDFYSSTSEHATHVAGTIAAEGIDTRAKGMSYKANVWAYQWGNDESEMALAASNGLRISNHSYGQPCGWERDYRNDGKWAWLGNVDISETEDYEFGYYSNDAKALDQIAYNAPYYLIVRSSGNERTETGPAPGTEHWVYDNGWQLSTAVREPDGGEFGYDCIQHDKVSKNIITVGAVNDVFNGYHQSGDVEMSSFSSWGNTDDGRVKPDIVANGVGLFSTSDAGNNSYTSMSGTSMSTPNVTGSLGLLLQLWKATHTTEAMLSSTLKGLVIHTADEAGISDGPDYAFGWGLLNTFKAAELVRLDGELGEGQLIRELELNNGETIEIDFEAGSRPVSATICWTDIPGTPVAPALDDDTPMLVNDLDIKITDPNGNVIEPWTLDPANPANAAVKGDNFRDNVEKAEAGYSLPGIYKVTISHKGTLEEGSQTFSLILSGKKMETPAQTTLLYPASGTQEVALDTLIEWSHVEFAENYHLQVATDQNFSAVILENESVYGIKAMLNDLPEVTDIFWRVRAENNAGYGEWSETFTFTTTIGLPGKPAMIYPLTEQDSVATDPEFIWSKDEKAENYTLVVANNAVLFSPVINEEGITDTTFKAEGLEDGKRYYWKVIANNRAGSGDYDISYFFTMLNDPDSLSLETNGSSITLTWNDNSENEKNYIVERKIENSEFSPVDTLGKNVEVYEDVDIVGGKYTYRVIASNNYGLSNYSNEAEINFISSVEELNGPMPKDFSLAQNYPNPFNPSTNISFALPVQSRVTIEVYDMLGSKVATIANNIEYNPGHHHITFNQPLSSGIYLYRISAAEINGSRSFNSVRKMILLK